MNDVHDRMPEPRRAALKELLLEQVAAGAPGPTSPADAASAIGGASSVRRGTRRHVRHLAAAASLATLAGLGGAALLGMTGHTSAQAETVHCYAQAPTAGHAGAVHSVAIEVPLTSGRASADLASRGGSDGDGSARASVAEAATVAGLAARAGCLDLWASQVLTASPGSTPRTAEDLVACRGPAHAVLVFPGARGDCARHGLAAI